MYTVCRITVRVQLHVQQYEHNAYVCYFSKDYACHRDKYRD